MSVLALDGAVIAVLVAVSAVAKRRDNCILKPSFLPLSRRSRGRFGFEVAIFGQQGREAGMIGHS